MKIEKNIGMIGVGKMGSGIGQCLISRGRSIRFFSRSLSSSATSLITSGATRLQTVAEVAEQCEVIILSLPSSQEVDEVCSGTNGILASTKPVVDLIIDTTSGYPSHTIEIASKLAIKGIDYADAPLTRGPREALEGRLNAILGGTESSKPKARSILEDFCEFIVETSGIGSAQKVKLVNNALSMSLIALAAEVSHTCDEHDIDEKSLRELTRRGGVNSGLLQGFFSWKIDGNKDALPFSIDNATKDLNYYLQLAMHTSQTNEIVKAAQRNFALSQSKGFGDFDIPNIFLGLKSE